KGGVVLEADWNGKVLWEVHHPDHHHHGILLRNGNVLLHCMAEVPDDIARRVTGGMVENNMQSGQYAPRPQAEAGKMYSDYLAEVTPAGQTVWQWRTVGASRSRCGWHRRGAGAAHALGAGQQRIRVARRRYPGELSPHLHSHSHLPQDGKNHLETRPADGCRPAWANAARERQHPDIRQRAAPSRRFGAVFESDRDQSSHKRDRMEVPG